jgi:hypothetical protein
MKGTTSVGELKKLMARSYKFSELLYSLRLPIIYSILALLSQDKVSLFNDRLIQLMEYLLVSEWNLSDEKADEASFLFERIALSENLDYKWRVDKNI